MGSEEIRQPQPRWGLSSEAPWREEEKATSSRYITPCEEQPFLRMTAASSFGNFLLCVVTPKAANLSSL